MDIRTSRVFLRFLTALTLAVSGAISIAAQTDPDPNSPTPILLSEVSTTRALAQTNKSFGKVNITKLTNQAFAPDSTINLYVTNISLMKGEGANAFRIYAEDKSGHQFRFPVLDLRPSEVRGTYILTVQLTDEIGYWAPPAADGDVLVCLGWRGLVSNSVKLGIGKTGGDIKEDPNARPTPLGTTAADMTAKGSDDSLSPETVGYRWSGDRIRFLEQATFGPTPALDDRIRRIGLRTWLAEQFEMQGPSSANPFPNIDLRPTNALADCDGANGDDVPATCNRDHYTMYPVQVWFFKEALYGEPQLRHRVTWALNQLWVISGVDTQQSSHMIAYDQKISQNAFGNWRNLMGDITLNPAMGNYLDMIRSTKTNPNENYPREILQLFNIGLFMLNQDGTIQCIEHNPCQAGDTPAPTYDQNVINNFTKVFTGWRDCNNSNVAICPNILPNIPDYKDPMLLVTGNHDVTAKTLLNYPGSASTMNIAACSGCNAAAITTYANNSLNQALDNIYNHPNVAPFVSKYLIQQLVTSDPTPAYVGRISAVFNANRTNPAQLKEVVKAILLDPEARGDLKTDPKYGKLREPVQLMTNLFRQVGVTSADGLSQSDGNINRFPTTLAQNVFFSPTVFNFYPPNYIVPGTTLLGPEFAIFNTGTAIGRANFANSMIYGQVNVSLPDTPAGTKLFLNDLQAIAAADTTSGQLMDVMNTRFMHGSMSSQMRSTITTAVNAVSSADTQGRVRAALYLIATSSQFQVQR